jgi:hypothetical protein
VGVEAADGDQQKLHPVARGSRDSNAAGCRPRDVFGTS